MGQENNKTQPNNCQHPNQVVFVVVIVIVVVAVVIVVVFFISVVCNNIHKNL